MVPDGFVIFGWKIYFYAIAIMIGVMLAAWLSAREAERRGENPDHIWEMLTWVVLGGILGARLWHVFTPTPSDIAQGRTTLFYLTHPLNMFNFREGGLGIPGAVIGGALVMLYYTRRHGLRFATWADIAAPGLALAQAIGRLGNFFNQELYGQPTNLPWAIYISPEHRLPQYYDQTHYHPLFLYEMIWNLFNMGLLLWLGRKFKSILKPGDIFLVYLMVYPLGRVVLEFLRLNSSQVAGLNANQIFMAIVAAVAALLLIFRHRNGPEETEVEEELVAPDGEMQEG